MTPELRTACEVIFQEHKTSGQPIKWDKDTFRGRISVGLSEIAKETLVKKNILVLPDKSKKIFTQLNPVVIAASSFEDAEQMIINKVPALVTTKEYDAETYLNDHVYGYAITPTKYTRHRVALGEKTQPLTAEIKIAGEKWYMKPFFYYVVWPICAVAAGVVVTRLIDLAYTELFLP